jgi:hypothetical protein
VHELPHGAVGEAQLVGDLVLRTALDGDLQQRLALALRQRCQPGERLAQHRGVLGQLGRAAVARERVAQLLVVVAGRAQGVERRVLHDPVQPRLQLAHVVAAAQRAPGGDERLLERVLGARLGQVALAVAQQRPAVALDDRLERALVARGGERDEPLVALRPQQLDRRRGHAGSGSSSSPFSTASRTTRSDSRLRSNSAGV